MTIETTTHDRQEFRTEIRRVRKAKDFGRVFISEHRDAGQRAQVEGEEVVQLGLSDVKQNNRPMCRFFGPRSTM